jgi:hypothetical protein
MRGDGQHPYIRMGDNNDICDQCGFKYKKIGHGLKLQWNNLLTCPKCYEERQPQDFVRGLRDRMTVSIPRPDNSNSKFVNITKDDF